MTGELSSRTAGIAAAFLSKGLAEHEPISNLKLQKLVALTESLVQHFWGRSALPEQVRAFENGPVVTELYGAYKHYGKAPITKVADVQSEALPRELALAVDEVWEIAGHIPAGGLWTLTHKKGPYQAIFDESPRQEIPGEELGRSWPDYVAFAHQLREHRPPVNTPIVGRGQAGFSSDSSLADAKTAFRPSRMRASG